MNKQSKKVELFVIQHTKLENNRTYLLHIEITKSHLNNRVCQNCGVKTSTVTPSFYYVFKSACPEKSKIERQISKSLKLWLLVVHIELFIAMWFIGQMVFCFGRK